MGKLPDLSDFVGRWSIRRTIVDKRAGVEGLLEGTAVFTAEGDVDEVRYEETGALHYADQAPMEATRRYVWRPHARGIEVLFDDGRPFHVIETDRMMPDANHYCGTDVYHVSYQFSDWPKWTTIWRVMGPTKDYRMTTVFRRAP